MNTVSIVGTVLLSAGLVLSPGRAEAASQDLPYGIASWPPCGLGNHRAVVPVAKAADAVRVNIPWRRRAQDPAPTGIVVIDAATGARVRNVAVRTATFEEGEIAFQPDTAPGDYYIYYMPYRHTGPNHLGQIEYLPFEETADPAWTASLTGAWDKLPVARVTAIQARTEFDRFDPMEVCATKAETEALVETHPEAPYLVFPEDRDHAIRMPDAVPLRWVQHGPTDTLAGAAMRGEYYTFQVGVFATKADLGPIRVTFGGLTGPGGTIPASEFTCFNTGGVDWLGRPFDKACTVPEGRIQASWCGVPIPEALAAGRYIGRVTVQPEGAPANTISLTIDIAADIIAEHGDNERWRMSRLRWLNSTLGLDDDIIPPYTPLTVNAPRVGCLLRDVTFGADGLPESIRANDTEILAEPIRFVVEIADGAVDWKERDAATVTKETPGKVEWTATRTAGPLTLRCRALMEFDGYINYFVELTASEPVQLNDARLEIPIRRDVATYMMGMGRKGGYRPESWEWDWAERRANNSLWLGDVQAGLHCKLKDPEDRWNLYHLGDDSVPESWENGGNGGCTLSESGDEVVIRAFSGARTMAAGETQLFRFGLLPTPVKPLDNAHWSQRYYHAYVPVKEAKDAGAKIINIHHGNELNPNINYPFIETDRLAAYVREAHDAGLKVKIYYTVRELSNRVSELWALRSLGHEIFTPGGCGGYSWLQEHLVTDYAAAWHERLPDGEIDGSIGTTGLSRWHNYYIEGLGWLLRHMEIDGLYLDGIGYNRDILQRCDDSVVMVADGAPRFIRRSRGYVPGPVLLRPPLAARVLACGGELKNTVAIGRERQVLLSQHIGDLDHSEAFTFFQHAIDHLQRILTFKPEVVACDLHPDYVSTLWAQRQTLAPVIGVQHHHAHMAAVMAEHHQEEPCIGIILDGTGYGSDGTVWGGEILIGDVRCCSRWAWLEPVPMPGGEIAVREPWRMALSQVWNAFGEEALTLPLACWQNRTLEEIKLVAQAMAGNVHAPLTSSCGRLFDAVASLIGLRHMVTFEAQAAIELEMLCREQAAEPYDLDLGAGAGPLPVSGLVRCLSGAVLNSVPMDLIAQKFHSSLAELFIHAAAAARSRTGINTVALSGGVYQNRLFLHIMQQRLQQEGFNSISHRLVPTNDGGLALGQVVIAGCSAR